MTLHGYATSEIICSTAHVHHDLYKHHLKSPCGCACWVHHERIQHVLLLRHPGENKHVCSSYASSSSLQLPYSCFAYPEFSEQQDRGYAFKNKNYQKTVYCDFPGSPVVETSCFSSRGHRFDSRSGTEILQASRHDTPPPKKKKAYTK